MKKQDGVKKQDKNWGLSPIAKALPIIRQMMQIEAWHKKRLAEIQKRYNA